VRKSLQEGQEENHLQALTSNSATIWIWSQTASLVEKLQGDKFRSQVVTLPSG
jgi:hypothetical protein